MATLCRSDRRLGTVRKLGTKTESTAKSTTKIAKTIVFCEKSPGYLALRCKLSTRIDAPASVI